MENQVMRKYGLIGHKIAYSLSPIMHNAAFNKLKLKAQYNLFDIEAKEIDSFLGGLLRSGISGLNVTVPYKLKVFDFVRKYGIIDKETEKLGAINTIVINDKTIFGFNTDTIGFIKSLKADLGFNPRMKTVIVFGAGGAGTACAIKLARMAEKVFICDRDEEKLKSFSDRFLKYYGTEKLSIVDNNEEDIKRAIANSRLLVNATPYGRNKGELLVNTKFLHKNLDIYDLIYSPSETPLILEARKMGLKAINGLGMLLHQGAAAFKVWTGRKAPIGTMRTALLKALEKQKTVESKKNANENKSKDNKRNKSEDKDK